MSEFPKEYDGFYFLPGDEDDEIKFQFFTLQDEFADGKPQDNTSVGDCFHIAFFKSDKEGNPIFDDTFEAIFACPTTYIKNLIGMDLYGCMLRKTDKSVKWFNDYLTRAKNRVILPQS